MQLHLLQHGLSVASIIISERSENRDKVGTKIYLLMLAILKIVGQYVSPEMSKASKCP